MIAYLIGSLAGRIAAVLSVVVIVLPYLLRRNQFTRGLGFALTDARPYLRRLTPHFWVGYAILALSTVHTGAVMRAMARANPAGIWAATTAFPLLVFEVALGLLLKEEAPSARRPLRRIHFWTMTVLAAALGLHVWLNG